MAASYSKNALNRLFKKLIIFVNRFLGSKNDTKKVLANVLLLFWSIFCFLWFDCTRNTYGNKLGKKSKILRVEI